MSTLRKRQDVDVTIVDDQSPLLDSAYGGDDWFNVNSESGAKGFINNTLSQGTAPGLTIALTFEGTQAILVGGLPLGNATYPSATYSVDGSTAGEASPFVDSSGDIIYFQSPVLAAGNHTILVTLTKVSESSAYYFDALLFVPISGSTASGSGMLTTQTVINNQASTATSKTPIGAIVGGVVGGVIVLLALAIGAFFFMRKKKSQPYYFDKPKAGDLLGGESEPLEYQAPSGNVIQNSSIAQSSFGAISSHAAPSTFASPSAYGASASEYEMSESGIVSNIGSDAFVSPSNYSHSQPSSGTGKGAYAQQLYMQNQPEPIQHADSGARFREHGGPPDIPTEVPPTYSVI